MDDRAPRSQRRPGSRPPRHVNQAQVNPLPSQALAIDSHPLHISASRHTTSAASNANAIPSDGAAEQQRNPPDGQTGLATATPETSLSSSVHRLTLNRANMTVTASRFLDGHSPSNWGVRCLTSAYEEVLAAGSCLGIELLGYTSRIEAILARINEKLEDLSRQLAVHTMTAIQVDEWRRQHNKELVRLRKLRSDIEQLGAQISHYGRPASPRNRGQPNGLDDNQLAAVRTRKRALASADEELVRTERTSALSPTQIYAHNQARWASAAEAKAAIAAPRVAGLKQVASALAKLRGRMGRYFHGPVLSAVPLYMRNRKLWDEQSDLSSTTHSHAMTPHLVYGRRAGREVGSKLSNIVTFEDEFDSGKGAEHASMSLPHKARSKPFVGREDSTKDVRRTRRALRNRQDLAQHQSHESLSISRLPLEPIDATNSQTLSSEPRGRPRARSTTLGHPIPLYSNGPVHSHGTSSHHPRPEDTESQLSPTSMSSMSSSEQASDQPSIVTGAGRKRSGKRSARSHAQGDRAADVRRRLSSPDPTAESEESSSEYYSNPVESGASTNSDGKRKKCAIGGLLQRALKKTKPSP